MAKGLLELVELVELVECQGSAWHQRPIIKIEQSIGVVLAILSAQFKRSTAFRSHQAQPQSAYPRRHNLSLI